MCEGSCRTQMGGFKLRTRYDLAGNSRGRARLLTQRKKGAHEGPRQALPRRSPGAQGHVQSTELRRRRLGGGRTWGRSGTRVLPRLGGHCAGDRAFSRLPGLLEKGFHRNEVGQEEE